MFSTVRCGLKWRSDGEDKAPGNSSEIRSIVFNSKDELYVDDAGFRLHVFDGNGKFVKTITLGGALNAGRFSFGVGTDGRIISQAQEYERGSGITGPRKIAHSVDILNEDGQFQKSIATFKSETPGLLRFEGGFIQPNNYCDPLLCLSPILADSFVYGFSSEYVLYVINSKGDPQIIIKLERKPSALSEGEKDQIVDRFRLFSYKAIELLRARP